MAKPIKDTPILCGKDAERFTKKTKENETQKVSKTEYDRVFGNYNKIKKIAKF